MVRLVLRAIQREAGGADDAGLTPELSRKDLQLLEMRRIDLRLQIAAHRSKKQLTGLSDTAADNKRLWIKNIMTI